ncbi:MAG TPA: histidine phosphatase family protein [Anaerolineales bacterium]|nr:histidine phosphatase family protein [Anaerolineales bacterium]
MPSLILIRHSNSALDPRRPAPEWGLTAEGRQRCQQLAEQLKPYAPDVLIASQERKAWQTTQEIATWLEIPWFTFPGLQEHMRLKAPYFPDPQSFRAAVEKLFQHPQELVFGEETAAQALARFSGAIDMALAQFADRSVGIITHGTVLSLFVANRCQLNAWQLWQSLELPAFVVLDIPGFKLRKVVSRLPGEETRA